MSWLAIIMGILFILVGSLFVLFADRFGKWGAATSFENNLNFGFPEYNKQTSMMTKEEFVRMYTTSHYYRIVIGLARIMGIMGFITGIVILIASFFNPCLASI